jgi:hypothetical protein
VSSAHKALSSALSGVVLQAEEQDQLAVRLKTAADKKLSDLLQVRHEPCMPVRRLLEALLSVHAKATWEHAQ